MSHPTHLRSVEEARQDLIFRGISMHEFACQHGLAPYAVYRLLNGKSCNTNFGKLHDAAIALGLKHGQRRS